MRRKRDLDPHEAAEILGGGVNVFARYENGKTKRPLALVKLLKVLENPRDLRNEIRSRPGSPRPSGRNPTGPTPYRVPQVPEPVAQGDPKVRERARGGGSGGLDEVAASRALRQGPEQHLGHGVRDPGPGEGLGIRPFVEPRWHSWDCSALAARTKTHLKYRPARSTRRVATGRWRIIRAIPSPRRPRSRCPTHSS